MTASGEVITVRFEPQRQAAARTPGVTAGAEMIEIESIRVSGGVGGVGLDRSVDVVVVAPASGGCGMCAEVLARKLSGINGVKIGLSLALRA